MASIGLVCLLREQAKQLEQERDELKGRVAFLEAVKDPENLLDVGAICDQRDSLAAQNEALRSALHKLACLGNGDSFGNSVGNCIAQDALNLPNLAESILKRRDAQVLRRAADSLRSEFHEHAAADVLRMIEK